MEICNLKTRVRADVLDASAAFSALAVPLPVVCLYQPAVLVDPRLVFPAVVWTELHDVDVVRQVAVHTFNGVRPFVLGAGVVTVTPEVEDLVSPCERQQVAAVQLKFLPQCYDVGVLPVGAV